MEHEQLHFVNGMLCKKVENFSVADFSLNIYRSNKIYFVFVGGKFIFDFKENDDISKEKLIDCVFKNLIECWDISDNVQDFSVVYFGFVFPTGNMMNQHKKLMERKNRLKSVVNQDFVDCLKSFIVMTQ